MSKNKPRNLVDAEDVCTAINNLEDQVAADFNALYQRVTDLFNQISQTVPLHFEIAKEQFGEKLSPVAAQFKQHMEDEEQRMQEFQHQEALASQQALEQQKGD